MTLLAGHAFGHEDGSGIELGTVLARSIGTDLRVVVVVPAPWPTPAAEGTDREFEQWAVETGDAAAAEARALAAELAPDLSCQVEVVRGRSVPATLVEQAERHEASMIVLGGGHQGPYGQVVTGTTADRLLHSSPVPVAVATRGYRSGDVREVGRATCAFRGDEVSRRMLEETAEICREVDGSLRIVTFAVRGRNVYPAAVGPQAEDLVLDAWVRRAEGLQQEAVDDLKAQGRLPARVETVVATGRSWAAALDNIPWERDDLLVIGSSPASFLSRLFLGSNGAKILRSSPVPVVVVP